jgi:hypothetical protein
MKLSRSHAALVGCLVVLQGADFILTWKLLSSPDVYEANPLALAILRRHGWVGLSLFKLGCTAVIITSALLLNRRRPTVSAWLLAGCCSLLTAVAGYSLALLGDANQTKQELARIAKKNDQIDERLQAVKRFLVARRAICRDLLEERIELPEALGELSRCIEEHRDGLSECLAETLPSADQPTRLAGYLVFHTEMAVRESPSLQERLPGLRRQAANYLGRRGSKAPLVISGRGGMVTALAAHPDEQK